MTNRHAQFWLTIGSMLTAVCMFLFMLFMGMKEQIQFNKEYCLLMIPMLIYAIGQFIVNYSKLTDENENK